MNLSKATVVMVKKNWDQIAPGKFVLQRVNSSTSQVHNFLRTDSTAAVMQEHVSRAEAVVCVCVCSSD